MAQSTPRNMRDYAATHRDFRWERPEHFNFATDVVDRHAAERGESLALLWSDETGREQRFTWQGVKQRSLHAAQFLTGLGLKKGDRAFIMMPRVPEWWFLVLGCIRAGIVFMPGTPMLTVKDIRYRLVAADANAVIADVSCLERFEGLAGTGRVETWVAVGEGAPSPWVRYESGTVGTGAHGQDFAPTRAEDPLLIYFTSGTTGMPKMVLHTQVSYGLGHVITGRYWLDLTPEDRHLTLSDTGWAKCAWGKLFGPWSQGACNVVYDFRGRFEPEKLLKVLASQKVTTFCAPPTAWRAMVLKALKDYDLSSLRHTVSAGEPLNPEVIDTWKAATGLHIREGYGQTETVVVVGMFPSVEPRVGSMGKPSPGFTVGVIDDAGQEVKDGQEGDIAVRVAPERPVGLFQEYLGDAAANAACRRGDWYVTGDRAVRDAEGYFWFVGRADDVIKTSGYRVGPFEVESALLEHAAVAESAVIGVPDDKLGQRVKAYVVLAPGFIASHELAKELQEHVKRTTAPYKYPREVEFVLELPKTVSGKIRRAELRATPPKPA
ncbi:AMP-binding protein [Myxococcus sp. K38C18041901]|uniref:acyl-CoA synthetase n=1 Tax=Myxococcus guangdongensis TaxID=2906760 RepID=UPI0020A7FB04|nr:AMP-binding protein [Myxococcus guangdongensis]MCP3058675.1 AMP-binding protein [Myxococcus guangdongensis]